MGAMVDRRNFLTMMGAVFVPFPPPIWGIGAVGWGANSQGQLGDATTTNRLLPTQVTGLISGVRQVSAGGLHSLALLDDGTVRAWGYNFKGQLGDGSTVTRLTPVAVTGLSGVIQVGAGNNSSLALRSDGTVWVWGHNGNGEMANGTVDAVSHPIPSQVAGLTGITQIAAGSHTMFALCQDGTVWSWGANAVGQAGDGTGVN